MGFTQSLRCRGCGHNVAVTVGVGFGYSDLRRVIGLIRGPARKAVLEILDNHPVIEESFEHRVYECLRCDTVHSRFYVRLKYDDGASFETTFKCRRCRRLLNPVVRGEDLYRDFKRPLESYSCEKCGGKELTRGLDMLWD